MDVLPNATCGFHLLCRVIGSSHAEGHSEGSTDSTASALHLHVSTPLLTIGLPGVLHDAVSRCSAFVENLTNHHPRAPEETLTVTCGSTA